MERKEKILEFIKDKEYEPMKLKEMAQVLMVPKEEQEELQVILDELEKEYKIKVDKKKIELKETIKTLGARKIDIKLYEGVIANLKINVISEN